MNARHGNTRNARWTTEPLGIRFVGYSFLLHLGVVLMVLALNSRLWPWQRKTALPAALTAHLVERDGAQQLERQRLRSQEQVLREQERARQAMRQRLQQEQEEKRRQEDLQRRAAAEQARKQAEARKAAEAEKARLQAETKAEEARKRAEAERQAAIKKQAAAREAAAEARRVAEAKAAAQRVEEARKHAAAKAEAAKRAADAKRAAEAKAAAAKAAEEARAQREAAMRQEVAQEQDRLRATQLAAARDIYLQALSHQVAQHWLRPPDVSSDLTCVVQVQQTKSGEVIAAKVVRGSGNAIFDRSVEAAVLKASPLPTPQEPELFDPVLNVTFHADDLSL